MGGNGVHYQAGVFNMAAVATYQIATRFAGRPKRVKVWVIGLVGQPTYRLSNIGQPPGDDIRILHDVQNADTPWVPGGEILEVRDTTSGGNVIGWLAEYEDVG